MRIPTFNKKQKELLADLWELDEYYRQVKKHDDLDLEMMKNYRGPTIKEREEMGI